MEETLCSKCGRKDCTMSNNGFCREYFERLNVPEWLSNLEYNDDNVIHYRNRKERRLYERNLKKNKKKIVY